MPTTTNGAPMRRPRRRETPKPIVVNASDWARQSNPLYGPGIQYGGNRDIYKAAGYATRVSYSDVLAAWTREHIAKRLIDIFPDYTWRKAPVIIDGPELDSPRDTPFCEGWVRLWESGRLTESGDTMVGLDWSVPELDRVALMGKWACLFLGFAGDKPLAEPVERGELASLGTEGLAYTAVYAEPNVTVAKWDEDIASPRFGKPLLYNLKSGRTTSSLDIGAVHWTRVIHLAHGGLADLIEGTPSISHVYNLLQDILKIVAGTGESGYRNADPGMIIKTQPAFEAPEAGDALDSLLGGTVDDVDDSYLEELKEGIEAYIHGLENYMVLEGYEVDMLTGTVFDPRGPISTLVDLVSGATGIPQRLLMGNEAGELASTQDQANWSAVIETRQVKVAQPMILRPLVNRLIWTGVLPEPTEGLEGANPYTFQWSSLYSIDPKVEAEVAEIVARVLKSLGVAVDPELFAAQYLPDLDPAALLPAGIPPAGDNPLDDTGNPFEEGGDEGSQEDGEGTEEDVSDDDNGPTGNRSFAEGPINGGKYP